MIVRISIFINAFLISFFIWYFGIHIGFGVYYQKYIFPRETFFNNIYYTSKIDLCAELNKLLNNEQKYIVFVGDSIIEQFPVYELFPNIPVLNRGVGNDTSSGVLKRINTNINNIKIGKIFIMIGHNDLKYRNQSETIENIKKILFKVKADEKYLFSILPSDDQNNQIIEYINLIMKQYCYENNIIYLDIYNMFYNNNKLYYDGVHLNIHGFIALKEIINQYIN